MTQERIVFVDTNVFIQLRDVADLPWSSVLPEASGVVVMVARAVVEELDKHKTSPRDRLRKRARLVLKLIDAAAAEPDRRIVLKEGPFRVTLAIASRKAPQWDRFPEFDASNPDDRLVAAAAMHGGEVLLLSFDSGPRLSALEIGLSVLAAPDDWALADEPSDQAQKISRLERQLATANSRHPELALKFLDAGEGVLRIAQPIIEPLSQATRDALVAAILSANPRAEMKAARGALYQLGGGSSEFEIETYNQKYREYFEAVQAYAARLHERIAQRLALPRVRYEVLNSGRVSATSLVVELDVEGFHIVADDEDIETVAGSAALPTAPEVPSRDSDLLRSLANFTPMSSFHHAGPRNPTEMQWLDRPGIHDRRGSYGCDDFRPQRVYVDEIMLWRTRGSTSGRFTVTASANDVSDVTASITILDAEPTPMAWTDERLLSLLPATVAAILSK